MYYNDIVLYCYYTFKYEHAIYQHHVATSYRSIDLKKNTVINTKNMSRCLLKKVPKKTKNVKLLSCAIEINYQLPKRKVGGTASTLAGRGTDTVISTGYTSYDDFRKRLDLAKYTKKKSNQKETNRERVFLL